MRQICCVILMVVFSQWLAGCQSPDKPLTVTNDAMIGLVDYDRLTKLMAVPDPKPVLVDVRIHKTQFEAQHIPGAIHIPLHKLRADNPKLQAAPLVIVYSQSRADSLSTAAAKKLMRYGLSVVEYRAGMVEWSRQQQKQKPKPNSESESKPEPKPK